MTVTFCGHGDEIYNEVLRERLYDVLEELINKGTTEFLLGGYGAFDLLAARTVKSLKEKYPHITSVLVNAYINRGYDSDLYDCSEYPPIENVPKRFAIIKRNEWMVKQADILIAYVRYDWGGAAKTLEYAMKKKKHIINLYEKDET